VTPERKAGFRRYADDELDRVVASMLRELLDALDEAERRNDVLVEASANVQYLHAAVAVVREIASTGMTKLNASDATRFRYLAKECLRTMRLTLDLDVLNELARELTWHHFPAGSPEAKACTALILAGYVEIRAEDQVKITPKGIKRLRELEEGT
jgi:hypothetical protein